MKTPSPIICEVMGRAGLDVICLDTEHAPFGRRDLDLCLMALRYLSIPSIVRIPTLSSEHILNALDCGATGVLVPHVITREDAQRAVDLAHYGRGRGYAGSSRSADYMGRSMAEQLNSAHKETCVIAQIEDADALDHLDDLFKTEMVDAFFIGRADLTVSLGYSDPNEPAVVDTVAEICRKGRAAGRTIGMFTGRTDEIATWCELGASLFLMSSDHAMLLKGAQSLNDAVRPQLVTR
ncbi:MAG: aldolase/citrate lyase family protein [Pseudomonadota bacterium]